MKTIISPDQKHHGLRWCWYGHPWWGRSPQRWTEGAASSALLSGLWDDTRQERATAWSDAETSSCVGGKRTQTTVFVKCKFTLNRRIFISYFLISCLKIFMSVHAKHIWCVDLPKITRALWADVGSSNRKCSVFLLLHV